MLGGGGVNNNVQGVEMPKLIVSRGLNSLVRLHPWGGHAINLLSKGGTKICSSTGGVVSEPDPQFFQVLVPRLQGVNAY